MLSAKLHFFRDMTNFSARKFVRSNFSLYFCTVCLLMHKLYFAQSLLELGPRQV